MRNFTQRRRQRRGAMLPLIAVALVLLFVAAVFAIDLARIHVTRSELRTATDAAARAAVEALGRTDSEAVGRQAALNVASRNLVAGNGLNLDESKIVFGGAEPQADGSFTFIDKSSFSDPSSVANAVRVTGERIAGSPDGPVNMMFGALFGQSTFSPVQTATATRLDRDISMILDKSGSMRSNGRMPALRNGLDVFINELQASSPQERVSLVAYDTFPRKLLSLTANLESLNTEFSKEVPGGLTGIGLAMRVGIDSVLNDPGNRNIALKSIVVMTDGNHNRGVSPLTVANEARNNNIVVHTITFSSGANQTLMRRVAERTGGTHIHATNDQQLRDAFQVIARQLQVLLIE